MPEEERANHLHTQAMEEQKAIAAQSQILISEPYPFSTYINLQSFMLLHSHPIQIPGTSCFMAPNGAFSFDVSHWYIPPQLLQLN